MRYWKPNCYCVDVYFIKGDYMTKDRILLEFRKAINSLFTFFVLANTVDFLKQTGHHMHGFVHCSLYQRCRVLKDIRRLNRPN